MNSYIEEEARLKKRLEELEKKYKESLFSENLKRTIEEKIRKDSIKEIEREKLEREKLERESKKEVTKDIVKEKIPEQKEIVISKKISEVKISPKVPEIKPVISPKPPEIKPFIAPVISKTEEEFEKKLKSSLELVKQVPKIEGVKKDDSLIKIKQEIFPKKPEETYIDKILKILPHKEIDKKSLASKEEKEAIEEKKTEDAKGKKYLERYKGRLTERPGNEEVKKCSENIKKIKDEMAKVLIGQEDIVEGLIMGLICNSHVLVEGVPGIAKTLAIRALAAVIGCDVKRVQFTVDLLPTDIIGITSYTPDKGFEIIKGPVFTNFLIADEINRAPPKTQSALIEAMQEKQVTIGRERFELPAPFFVMATENPIENAGVYPLPEAQIDRFLFKLVMGYPKEDEERIVMESNMTLERFEEFNLKAVVYPQDIIYMQGIVKKVYLDESIKSYILSIVRKTRERDFSMAQYISYGSSPRASIGLYIASKANALMNGRTYVLPEDVKKVVFRVMRHRLILSYKATIQKISEDAIIKDILNSIKVE